MWQFQQYEQSFLRIYLCLDWGKKIYLGGLLSLWRSWLTYFFPLYFQTSAIQLVTLVCRKLCSYCWNCHNILRSQLGQSWIAERNWLFINCFCHFPCINSSNYVVFGLQEWNSRSGLPDKTKQKWVSFWPQSWGLMCLFLSSCGSSSSILID